MPQKSRKQRAQTREPAATESAAVDLLPCQRVVFTACVTRSAVRRLRNAHVYAVVVATAVDDMPRRSSSGGGSDCGSNQRAPRPSPSMTTRRVLCKRDNAHVIDVGSGERSQETEGYTTRTLRS